MKRSSFTLVLFSLLALTTACMPPYRQTFNDEGKARGWTQKQTDAAYAYADRIFWSREVTENKYVIAYGKVPTSKVREQLGGVLKDLDAGLDPKNQEMRQYFDTFNLRKEAEHDEEVAQAIYDRVHAYELQTQFKQKMGDIPEDGPEATIAQGYNIRKIYVNKPMADAFPFTSDVIESAKKSGTLKQVAQTTLDESIQYDHKEPNPKNPDDANDFIWKSRSQKIVLTEYKIVDVAKPLDNKGDYIEGYRVIDGKQESLPAIKVFFPSSGDMALMLIDSDEQGMPGFGIPDVISQLASATHVQDLIKDGTLLNSLFDKKEVKKNRVVEQAQLFKIEIVPLGAHIDEWQKSPDAEGWIVPFKYTDERGDNYNVRIHYKKPNFDPATMTAHPHSEYAQLEYIEKEYTKTGERFQPSAGRVIEYYRPKGEFTAPVKAQVLYEDDTKKIQFQFEDGSVVEGFITPGKNKFTDEKPFAKSFTEGQKRYWIESSSNDGKYDKRKAVGQPKEDTGEYSDDQDVFHAAEAARPGKGWTRKPEIKQSPQP